MLQLLAVLDTDVDLQEQVQKRGVLAFSSDQIGPQRTGKGECYLACYGLAVKVEWELFPSILVDLDLDHLALFLAPEHHLDIDWCRERKDILQSSIVHIWKVISIMRWWENMSPLQNLQQGRAPLFISIAPRKDCLPPLEKLRTERDIDNDKRPGDVELRSGWVKWR